MIQFQYRPDAVFKNILDSVLAAAIDDCNMAIEEKRPHSLYVSDDILQLFGGIRTLSAILNKLRAAHDSTDVWEISPYYNLLLDDLITMFVELYNDGPQLTENDYLVHPSGRTIKTLDVDAILDHYFPDRDYLFDPATANQLSSMTEEKALLGIEPEALNAARRIPPDSSDLWIRKSEGGCSVDIEGPDWFSGPAAVGEPDRTDDAPPAGTDPDDLPF